jgi:large subunit ribosomal protein L15
LLGGVCTQGTEKLHKPLHLQVSSVSPKALQLVEGAGGSVERVYYTRLGLKALLKPENFEKKGLALPRPVRAWPPRENGKFDVVGQLPPVKQLQQVVQQQ